MSTHGDIHKTQPPIKRRRVAKACYDCRRLKSGVMVRHHVHIAPDMNVVSLSSIQLRPSLLLV
ncbi:hypothetical protein BJX66DRAFT_294686 [Aspergillus keveii]|uniref:Uncharacterized protein n=1 Tax=Aspergillus keveii TaxID=714993 RepID=A0ABR4GI27_9EURO